MYETTRNKINEIASRIKSKKTRDLFLNAFWNTIDTAISPDDGNGVYVLAGDIPAMWLRDSSCSVWPYLPFAKEDKDMATLIRGVLKKLFFYIDIDPYGNSFLLSPEHKSIWDKDETEKNPYTWERKFEIDSLAYPIRLAYGYIKETGDTSILDKTFLEASRKIIEVIEKERKHTERSSYSFFRPSNNELDVPNRGKGAPIKENGLIWTAFRPSDDASMLGLVIPCNALASVSLHELSILLGLLKEEELSKKAERISIEVKKAIYEHGVVEYKGKKIFAYETDGLGHYSLMDDANVPSILSLPYIGFLEPNDPIYLNSREFILSKDNPYYYEGKALKGVGSPHTPEGNIWHMALSIEGLTSLDDKEKIRVMDMIVNSTSGTSLTHESVNKDDPSIYTRAWFTWSNALYSEFVIKNLALWSKGE